MPNSYSSTFEKRGGYIFTRESLIDINSLVQEFIGESPKVSFRLEGEHKIEGDDLIALLDDLYVKNKSILECEISGGSRSSRFALLSFKQGGSLSPAVRVTLSGDGIESARAKIEQAIDGRSQWYSRLFIPDHPAPLVAAFFGSMVVTLLLAGQLHVWLFGSPFKDKEITIALILLWVLIWAIFWFFKRRMFPRIGFDFGRSADIVRSAQVWRSTIFIGGVLAIIISIASELIVDRIK